MMLQIYGITGPKTEQNWSEQSKITMLTYLQRSATIEVFDAFAMTLKRSVIRHNTR